MSLKRRWEGLAGALDEPTPTSTETQQPIAHTRAGMMVDADRLFSLNERTKLLEKELAEERKSKPIQLVDPRRVRPSVFMNRHPASFETPEYLELVADIRATGGNLVEVRVRPIQEADHDYEIIAGHRRHRAAIDTGTRLKVVVENVTDEQLYTIMGRENAKRQDLSPWEWGLHYEAGLREKVATQATVAEVNGMSKAHVSMALELLRLPREVVDAFPSPLALQFGWGKPLRAAAESNAEKVLAVARELAARPQRPTAKEVYRELLEAGRKRRAQKPETTIRRRIESAHVKGTLRCENGVTTIALKKKLNEEQADLLQARLSALMGELFNH